MRRLLPMLLLLGAFAPVADAARPRRGDDAEEELAYLVVAATLIGDGHYDRAVLILEEVDLEAQGEDFDLPRYWRLLGLCHFQLGATDKAVADFRNAIAAGEANPEIWLRLAQAQAALEDHEGALASLDEAGATATAVPGGYMLRARSLIALERFDEAWAVLDAGRGAFPAEAGFDRESLFLLIQLNLYQEARSVGARYLQRRQDEPAAWFAVGEALRRSGNLDEAAAILEGSRVRFPDEVDAYTLLAKTYVDMRLPGACGTVLQQAAELDPALAAASADCFRDAGFLERAMYMNTLVPEADTKARQRLDLLVRSEDWGQAIALMPRLSRLGLLDEDPVAYAAAYALFQSGDYDRAEDALKRIDDPQLFKDSAALRKAMADCEANRMGCL